jgi:hypothetical protein
MPYHRNAIAHINVKEKCNIELITYFRESEYPKADMAYLHIEYVRKYPTQPGKTFTWLDVEGQGHYAGVYLRASGESLSDTSNAAMYWTGCLEGDEMIEVDEKMVEHGTGTEDYFNADGMDCISDWIMRKCFLFMDTHCTMQQSISLEQQPTAGICQMK